MSKKEKSWFVYIIQCKDDLYYVGLTDDISKRYGQHLSGLGSRFTAIHGVKKLVYIEEYDDFDCARYREKQIKNWNRAKKEKLIKGKWGKIE
jgi:putative endonuclease